MIVGVTEYSSQKSWIQRLSPRCAMLMGFWLWPYQRDARHWFCAVQQKIQRMAGGPSSVLVLQVLATRLLACRRGGLGVKSQGILPSKKIGLVDHFPINFN